VTKNQAPILEINSY